MSSILDVSREVVHSAQVKMRLKVGGLSLPIAQLGSEFIILEKTAEFSATQGEIVMCIDARERRRPVTLPDGLTAPFQWTRILRE